MILTLRRHLMYLHGEPWWIDPRHPVCPVCEKKLRICW